MQPVHISPVDMALGDPVEGDHELVRLPGEAAQLLAGDGGQSANVGRMLPVRWHKAESRDDATVSKVIANRIKNGRGRRRRILGKHGENEDPVGALLGKAIEGRWERWIPIAHANLDEHALKGGLEGPALLEGGEKERRALLGPHSLVERRGARRPEREDAEVQDQPPRDPVELNQSRIGEELAKVPAQGGRGGGIGRSELGDDDANAWRVHGGIVIRSPRK